MRKGPSAHLLVVDAVRIVTVLLAPLVLMGCARSKPEPARTTDDAGASAVATVGASLPDGELPPPKGLPPDGGVPERFYLDVQRVDEIGSKPLGGATTDARPAATHLRVYFSLTWSGPDATNENVDPALVDDMGHVYEMRKAPWLPRLVHFERGVSQPFVGIFDAPTPGHHARLRPMSNIDAGLELSVALTGHVEPPQGKRLPPGFRALAGPGFALSVPDAWLVGDAPKPPVVAAAYARDAPGGFKTGISLTREPFASDAGSFAATSVAKLRAEKSITLDDEKNDVAKAGRRVTRILASSTPPPGTVGWKSVQWIAADSTSGWVLTCIGPTPVFDALRPVCETIAESWVLER